MEKTIQTAILKYLNSLPNCMAFKVSGGLYQVPGISDIIGTRSGKFFAIEVKDTGKIKNETELQKAFGAKVKKAGGFYICTDSLETVKGAIF